MIHCVLHEEKDSVAVIVVEGIAAGQDMTALILDEAGLHAVGPTTLLDVRAASVVVATGSHEQLPLVSGNDRPGVMGARTVEWLIRGHGVVPGSRAVLVGDGPQAARFIAAMEARQDRSLRLLGLVDDQPAEAIDAERGHSGLPRVGSMQTLCAMIRRGEVDQVIFTAQAGVPPA